MNNFQLKALLNLYALVIATDFIIMLNNVILNAKAAETTHRKIGNCLP